ncbi:hypothetical protein F5Y03DRAFT_286812 [Xylaria venustula]|nr:hypothetical protein F5Y03DRAFT_286812 [Xylaria venustula]
MMSDGPDGQDVGGQGNGSHSNGTIDGHLASSKHRLHYNKNPSSSRLENLPAELRIMILMRIPDLLTLRSLVHASPMLHTQYRHSRDGILRAFLNRELDGFLVDAYATAISREGVLGPRTDKAVTEHLDLYQSFLSEPTSFQNIKIDPDSIRWMAAFHISVAQPLARLYSNWALTNLNKSLLLSTSRQGVATTEGRQAVFEEEESLQEDHDVELSISEEIRIFRALYRYETYHHLFGETHDRHLTKFYTHEIHELFFCLFDPWDAEAVGCIELFVRLGYEGIFHQIEPDLPPIDPRFERQDGIHTLGIFHGMKEWQYYMVDGTSAWSLETAAQLLVTNDHGKLVPPMRRCLKRRDPFNVPMREIFEFDTQSNRREISPKFPTDRDIAEQMREVMHFMGDTVPPDRPPVAWVVLWGRKYSNIYGEYVPQLVRRWGYVMWDEDRWVDMGADESFIVRQWEMSPNLVRYIKNDYNWRPV